MENIEENKKKILTKIQQAHITSNFSSLPYPKLVAVSKKQKEYKIELAIKSGQRIYGDEQDQKPQMLELA